MNRQMKKYKDSFSTMQGPISLSQCPDIKLDLRGLIKYAKKKVIHPYLTIFFVKEK